MLKKEYDIIIIGAGPAGNIAAKFASEGGASVLVVERDREIGLPVRCAEGVGAKGLSEFFEPDPYWISNTIYGARLIAPNGTSVEVSEEGMGYMLERRLFDTELARQAIDEGAEYTLRTSCYGLMRDGNYWKVQVKKLGQQLTLKAKIVIGADGVESRVGRWAGLSTNLSPHDIEPCLQYVMSPVYTDKNYCEFYFGSELAPGGYLWIFPKQNGLANVGLGVCGDYPNRKPTHYYLDKFVNEHLPDAKILSVVCGGVPVKDTLKNIITDGLMLTGDAARMVNPLSGGGIINGMIGGKLAGQIAAEAIKKENWSNKFLKTYEKRWHKRIGKDHKLSYILKEAILKLTDKTLNDTAEALKDLPAKDITIMKIFSTVFKSNPKLLLTIGKVFLS